MRIRLSYLVTIVALAISPVLAGTFDSGSDGTDGAFNPLVNTEVDLSLAASLCDCDGGGMLDDPCRWDCPSPVAGQGVYDAEQWAVVFKYTTIDIPAGVTVTFKNHTSGAPVVWLASSDVAVSGMVNLDGDDGDPASPFTFAVPGSGGFSGGQGGTNSTNIRPSPGFGPGGGEVLTSGRGGGYATSNWPSTPTYGNGNIVPLIGGSGGAGVSSATSPGAGGVGAGALLIASSGAMLMDAGGSIRAEGGNGAATPSISGGGSGGAIRLVASTISGAGLLRATGGDCGAGASGACDGGDGRIRVEANFISLTDGGNPNWTSSTPGPVFPPAGSPTLKATLVDGETVPSDLDAGILTTDLEVNNENAVTVNIEATNIPVGTTVDVRVLPGRGDVITTTSTPLADAGGGLLTATASVTLPPGRSEIQLRANWTP